MTVQPAVSSGFQPYVDPAGRAPPVRAEAPTGAFRGEGKENVVKTNAAVRAGWPPGVDPSG